MVSWNSGIGVISTGIFKIFLFFQQVKNKAEQFMVQKLIENYFEGNYLFNSFFFYTIFWKINGEEWRAD